MVVCVLLFCFAMCRPYILDGCMAQLIGQLHGGTPWWWQAWC